MKKIHIAIVASSNYYIPVLMTANSILQSKNAETVVRVHILTDRPQDYERLLAMNGDNFSIEIHAADTKDMVRYDISDSKILSANYIGLLKFRIGDLLPDIDRVIYLDCDVLIKKDLSQLYETELAGLPLAAVPDTGAIYFHHKYVKEVQFYFNSGLLLLDLEKLRLGGYAEKLFAVKGQLKDSLFMDQDAFNVVFDGNYLRLPTKYNLLITNLFRATGKWKVDDINKVHGTDYKSLNEMVADAYVLHFASRDKPWQSVDLPINHFWVNSLKKLLRDPTNRNLIGGGDFQGSFSKLNFLYTDSLDENNDNSRSNGLTDEVENIKLHGQEKPSISVIIPVYNTGEWCYRAIKSMMDQTKKDIEIIVVNNGSTDNSDEIIKNLAASDSRIKYLSFPVSTGQSVARNRGLLVAEGKYVYFLDSDDFLQPTALEKLYLISDADNCDLVLFGGESLYTSSDLESKYPQYHDYYKKKGNYSGISSGTELFPSLIANKDNAVVVYLMFIKKSLLENSGISFYENVIYEDNLFFFKTILCAKRASVCKEVFHVRTVRDNSTMTSTASQHSFGSAIRVAGAMWAYAIGQKNLTAESFDAASHQLLAFSRYTANNFAKNGGELQLQSFFSSNSEKFLCELLSLYIQTRVAEKDLQGKVARLQKDTSSLKKKIAEYKGDVARLHNKLQNQRKKVERYEFMCDWYLKFFPRKTRRYAISRLVLKKIYLAMR